MIYVGTAGWSYPQGAGKWDGVFYPADRRVDRLAYYAERFDAVEINSTFYRPPEPAVTRAWARKTPPRFRFTAKLYQKFTHPKMYAEVTGSAADLRASDFEQFKRGIAPLAEAGKLGALLAQFPPSFKADEEALTVLEDLLRQFREYPLAVELRHRSWSEEPRAAALLHEYDATWCLIDEPKFRSSIGEVPLTGRLGYLRFHGRNAAQWWKGDRETRYDYLYSPAEQTKLAAEVRAVAQHAEDTYVFYNNHYGAKAVANAVQLKAALGLPLGAPLEPTMLATYPELARLYPAGGAASRAAAPHDEGASRG
ncbi:MAG TPA: DUF72 domain-containing protein [Chloroflexota bacterium]|jgi:uncharacterized protein YecE (DUF72 family)|nr:DUF72 domain-containing protein [Chloroflexota bacterium]